jgi:hypothetical protein
MPYDRLYVEFLYFFNVTRDYFECHEVMEELWMEQGRSPFCQGLLQVAVSLYHFRGGNRSGAVKLMTAAIDKLSPYPAATWGIDLGRLLEECREYLARLERYSSQPFEFYDLDIVITDPALEKEVAALQKNPPASADEEHH